MNTFRTRGTDKLSRRPVCLLVRHEESQGAAPEQCNRQIDTIEYDYPTFHLSMDCFYCEVKEGHLELKEAEAAKWLTRENIDDVAWLPADITLIDKIKSDMEYRYE